MASSIRLLSRRLPTLASQVGPRQSISLPRLQPVAITTSRVNLGRKIRQFHNSAAEETEATASRQFHASTAEETEPTSSAHTSSLFSPLDTFQRRHIGPSSDEVVRMLAELNYPSLDAFVRDVLPPSILSPRNLKVSPEDGLTESQLLDRLKTIAKQNRSDLRSFIGCGYAGTVTPNVILRNILECPEWYTSYTPYQPEISQGRLESLLNFQTVVTDLTGMTIANASVLDEATAASEAMTMSLSTLPIARQKRPGKTFFVDKKLHPQTIASIYSRAEGFGINILVGDALDIPSIEKLGDDLIGVMVQYPATDGIVNNYSAVAEAVHKLGAPLSVATDLLALTLLKAPGEWGADIVFGNSQRFGVPFGYGGPHAGFFATSEKHKRKIPGRLIGVSKDRLGDRALRLALQTREQHIRREKATSNICTAQALLANMAAMYAVYHGPQGLKGIAERVVGLTKTLERGVERMGLETVSKDGVIFDTVLVKNTVGITLDETVIMKDMVNILSALNTVALSPIEVSERSLVEITQELGINTHQPVSIPEQDAQVHPPPSIQRSFSRTLNDPSGLLHHELNATTEMIPVSWPEFNSLHPFIPLNQARGYSQMLTELEKDLSDITGFAAVSLQPNSGAQGEFTGLRVIREYLKDNGQAKRDVCLIPVSAHGTNPASAAMAGMRVVPIKCDLKTGNLDIKDLELQAEKHKDFLAAIMITYPSTYGVFEPEVKRACEIVHENGGLVYMDGANMNAQVGLCSPGEIGADVCHLNLHKTFCIPHGGGGPGVGPIGVTAHLAPYLPGHPLVATGGEKAISPVSSAPWGSASILPITWSYIKMMGARGLTHATKITLLNANYMASRLSKHYKVLYTNSNNRCAHEFILDVRGLKETAGIEAIDIAKRLQDYGFHAPTMSWPVPNTLMIEPTESENVQELDRYCDALIAIREEIRDIEEGRQPRVGNLLKNAPHTQKDLLVGEEGWMGRSYTRERAAYPLEYLRERKFWPTVTRVDDVLGDLNLFCTCDPVTAEED
ncbi:glycine cleavage system P-protein-domain-containing protein [Terfezia claveryi]|nr:glycine cleavage system P-protein-domain-containing protein [Terfezia claveryi]